MQKITSDLSCQSKILSIPEAGNVIAMKSTMCFMNGTLCQMYSVKHKKQYIYMCSDDVVM